MLASGVWGKRKPRGRRLGWARSDARGTMWAGQEGLHHPHSVARCPSSSSSSISCSGKGPAWCPCSRGSLESPLLQPLPAALDRCCWVQSWEQRGPVGLCARLSPEGLEPCLARSQPPLFLCQNLCPLCAPTRIFTSSCLRFPVRPQLNFFPFGSCAFFCFALFREGKHKTKEPCSSRGLFSPPFRRPEENYF